MRASAHSWSSLLLKEYNQGDTTTFHFNIHHSLRKLFKKKKTFYLFCTVVQPINNVVLVSGEQQRDSAIHTHVSILLQTPLPSRLPQNSEQSSMCYTVGPCWLSILNIAVCAKFFFFVIVNLKNWCGYSPFSQVHCDRLTFGPHSLEDMKKGPPTPSEDRKPAW